MLEIRRIKPNPAGKDTYGGRAPASQLAAEWVDITNVSTRAIVLNGISIYHRAFTGRDARWALVTSLQGSLPAGRTLRVHSGHGGIAVVQPGDLVGADYHAFTGEDRYVWNNREGDTPLLWQDVQKVRIDAASYDPNPPEGAVLVRLGDRLVPQTAQTWVG